MQEFELYKIVRGEKIFILNRTFPTFTFAN